MKIRLAAIGAMTACAALTSPASAVVTISSYALVFLSGSATIAPPVRTAPGEYQDNFTFTTDKTMTFSGSLSTQRLFGPLGGIVSDLDFGNTLPMDGVHLDSVYFTLASGGSDALEVQTLPTTPIGPGNHVLTVNYTVQTADLINGAIYAGPVFLAPSAVPEASTWALMIVGFGAVGLTVRRRPNRHVSMV
jgi:hypothetical protein